MGRNSSKEKAIHYKCVAINGSHETLQSLLEQAFDAGGPSEMANLRREQMNQDELSFRLINHHSRHAGMIFGELVFFEAGASQPYIDLQEGVRFFSIDALTTAQIGQRADQEDGVIEHRRQKKEFINSILYFGVLDNHMVLLQSPSLRARELETHLNWLLNTQAGLLRDTPVILHDVPSSDVINKLERKAVRKIRLGAPVEIKQKDGSVDQYLDDASGMSHEKVAKLRFEPDSAGAEVVKSLVPGWLGNPNLTDALDDANLRVSLEITYRRKTTASGQRVLDSLAGALRHAEESDVKIELKGGGTISGADLRLSGKVRVKTLPSGLLDENNLYHQMHAWLYEQIAGDRIEAAD